MKEKIKQISVPTNATIRDALYAIDRGALGIALLINNKTNAFIGMLTDGDIRRALLTGAGLNSSVEEIDHPETVVATSNQTMEQIVSMFSTPVRIVPVLNENREVIDLAFFDNRAYLPVAEPKFGEKELRYVSECVLSGWVSSAGSYVKKFEKQFKEFCNTKYAVATCNGTAALHLAALSCEIGPGDEVIIPAFTFISTANAIAYTGAKPVFVDSQHSTWNIDPEKIEQAITTITKAIVVVHIYGHPADMDPILELAKKYNLKVIEDAAEAHGALYRGKKVGSIGDVGIFSFFGNKTITTGEGGMVVTNNEKIYKKTVILRDHGMDPDRRYWHPVLGYNYRLTNIQAALGCAQMERINDILEKKRNIAFGYNKGLGTITGLTLPPEAEWAKNIYWLYSILVDEKEYGISANMLADILKKNNVETRPLFPPIHKQPVYNTNQKLSVAEHLYSKGLSLPSSVNLNSEDIKRTIEIIADFKEFQ